MVDACVLTDHEAAKILECPDLREPRHGARQPDGERRRSQRARPRVAEHARPGVIDLYTDTHPFNGPMSGTTGTRKVKPIWILPKQDTVNGSGIRWAICKSAPRSRQITMSAPHHSDALPDVQPTASKH